MVKLKEWSEQTYPDHRIIEHLKSTIQRNEEQIQYWKNQVEKCEKELERAEGRVEIIDMTSTAASILGNVSSGRNGGSTSAKKRKNRRQLPTGNNKRAKAQQNKNNDDVEDVGDAAATVMESTTVEGRDYLSLVEGAIERRSSVDELERVSLE